MKACQYCGKENDDETALCVGCGTAFQQRGAQPDLALVAPPLLPPTPPGPRVLNGGSATIALLIYLAAQFAAGVLGGFFVGFMMGLRGDFNHDDFATMSQTMMPLTVFLIMAFGWIAIFVIGRSLGFQLNDATPTGAAWVRGSQRDIIKGLFTGIAVSVLTLLCLSQFGNTDIENGGPLTRMSVTPGITRVVWVLTAIVLAPPIEELLFRGVLYGGYRKSFGPTGAAALTTVIFITLHFTELIHQPLATLGITGLALAALWWRIRSSAIGPAIAVHFGYNATLVLAVLSGH